MERTTKSIRFDHFVEFPSDAALFGAGYEEQTGRIRLFLIFNETGRIYTLCHNSLQPVGSSEAEVINRITSSANREGIRSYISREPIHGNLPQYFSLHHGPDRKSTRLNSSHSSISYAVFCLKK